MSADNYRRYSLVSLHVLLSLARRNADLCERQGDEEHADLYRDQEGWIVAELRRRGERVPERRPGATP